MVTPDTNALSGVGPWGHMLLSAGNILPAGLAQCTFAHTCERINKARKGIEKAEKGEQKIFETYSNPLFLSPAFAWILCRTPCYESALGKEERVCVTQCP